MSGIRWSSFDHPPIREVAGKQPLISPFSLGGLAAAIYLVDLAAIPASTEKPFDCCLIYEGRAR